MNNCIYRTTTEICPNPKHPYCTKHSHIKNVVFNYCFVLLGNKRILNYYDIIRLYSTIMVDYRSHLKTQQILKTLVARRKAELFPIAAGAGYRITKKSVKACVMVCLFERLSLVYVLSHNKTIKRIFRKLWKMWKAYAENVSGKDLGHPCNPTDIFTLEQLEEIPYLFSFKDVQSGFVYGFCAIHLYKYLRSLIDNNEPLQNPYNRKPMHDSVLIRLRKYLSIKNLSCSLIEDDRSKWVTPEMAYTDVVIMFQQKGFYSSIEWFIAMDYSDVMNVINRFHEYSTALNYDTSLMIDQTIPNEHPEYVFRFCSLCMELFRCNHFGKVTILFKSLIDKIKQFDANAPSWILNVHV